MNLLGSYWIQLLWRLGLKALKFNAVLVAIVAGLLYTFQGKMIYPSSMPPGSREKVPTPSDFEMNDWEEVDLMAPDKVKTKAFVILAAQASEKKREANELAEWRRTRPTILMLHANAGNVGHRLPIAKIFVQKFGCNIVAISYRGYGHSSGSPSETGILLDSQVALDYLKSHPILEATPVFLYGQSLGGAVAVALACDKVNAGKIAGVILENTFANLRKLVPIVMPIIGPLSFLCHQTWYSDRRLSNLSSTVSPAFLFLSGSKDDLIPPSHFRELFDLCPSKRKRWQAFADGTHNDTCLQKDYFSIIGSWIDEMLSTPKLT
ncbi:hypothetical protein O181_008618 [Austropuccinia psidii MF-1]|uniref:AB hydrolase-1 domain-containing protein n=1 Tax=Austropuccinia psidii MF-1 TaxID=1389203 RepID=A0A9Q3BPH4_9BASI|nr:hypothetical protein [Austropuccinia psidii MF-1]